MSQQLDTPTSTEDPRPNHPSPADATAEPKPFHISHTTGFHHINVWAFDIDATIAFYEQAFGFRLIFRWQGVDGVRDGAHHFYNPLEGAHLDMGDGQILELVPVPDAAPKDENTASFNHLGLRIPDLDEVYAQALAAGAEPYPIHGADGTVWDGITTITLRARAPFERSFVARAAHVRGPNGEVIELFES